MTVLHTSPQPSDTNPNKGVVVSHPFVLGMISDMKHTFLPLPERLGTVPFFTSHHQLMPGGFLLGRLQKDEESLDLCLACTA